MMAHDDRRMHEGDKSGVNPGRGHEHREDTASKNDSIGINDDTPADGPVSDVDPDGDNDESALGGHVATRSSTAPTPEQERTS